MPLRELLRIELQVTEARRLAGRLRFASLPSPATLKLSREPGRGLELLIIDGADRLKTAGLEMVRDYFDNGDVGIIHIGMPRFERRLAR